jgi:Ca-activated chloride channel family protein
MAVVTGPAAADVDLRVEGRPPSDPIQVFVRVTDSQGAPVTGLTAADFTVLIDGVEFPLQQSNLTLPPSEDPNQHVSVVFAMDYTSSVTDIALDTMQNAVIAFINAMNPGDMAAIVKFNNTTGASVVAAFTEIDGGGNPNNEALEAAVLAAYPGDGSNILDATNLALEQFATATLPGGPKAVVLVTDGIDTHSSSNSVDVIDTASENSIPIFTIAVGDPNQQALNLMNELADETGGEFFLAPTGQDIEDAYAAIFALLASEYLITIPETSIADCAEHELEVTVNADSRSVMFTRRQCDTTPNNFTFASLTNVRVGANVTSEEVTISGIEVPAHISVIQGRYSIGCTDTFTNDPATISDGDTVCIRQTAADQPSTSRTTTLTVGGFAATFTTTTGTDSGGGGGGGGGGGATGLLELLLGLGLLLGRRVFTR